MLGLRNGFTLVEILVATLVLSLLVLIIAQVVALTSQVINIDSRTLEASAQARLVFDRLGIDLSARLNRPDVGTAFTKETGSGVSDCLRFYSQVSSYVNVRGVTAVGYRIQTSTPGRIYQLERGAVGMDWSATSTGLQFLPAVLEPAVLDTADNADYDVLASGVFRLEFCYQLKNGTLTINSPASFSTVSGLVIAIGVLDAKSLTLLGSNPTAPLSALSSALVKTTDGNDPCAAWNTAIQAGLVVSGVPKSVLQNVHVYERTFYVQ